MRIYVTIYRYGLSFDVQHHRKLDGSFRGHLWSWDYRRPWRIHRCD